MDRTRSRHPLKLHRWTLLALSCASWALIAPTSTATEPDGDAVWELVERPAIADKTEDGSAPAPDLFRVDTTALEAVLWRAPLDSGLGVGPGSEVTLDLPMPDGTLRAFRIEESPIMAPALAARYPEIKTYTLQGVDAPSVSGRLSHDQHGLQALLLTPDGVVQVNPDRRGHPFYRSLVERPDRRELACQTPDAELSQPLFRGPDHPDQAVWERLDVDAWPPPTSKTSAGLTLKSNPSGATLRTYRLAVATTGEYYDGRDTGGGDADVLASIVAVINRVNAVYETEVAIRFVLVADNDQLLFGDGATDGYTNGTPCTMRTENTPIIDAAIGADSYDIGHVFGKAGGGGCAGGSVVCTNNKGSGASGLRTDLSPTQEGFSGYRLVAHEMGHQFGAGHTWSGKKGNCTSGEFSPGDAYEPLSGTTLMSYSGSCDSDNVQGKIVEDRYFHTHSFDQVVAFSTTGAGDTCAQSSATGNAVPMVDAGPDYTIPRETPFVLSGSATDADDATLSYTWEQLDATPERVSPLKDIGNNPLFRSFPPVPGVPSRTLPQLGAVLGLLDSPGELLPTGDRSMTFRLTARDNRAGGGGVNHDTMTVSVEGPPFDILAPNGGETLRAGCVDDVIWDVGGGSVAAEVDLLLSTDGGASFDPLLTGTVNDGAEPVTVACTPSTSARIRADAVNNIFFDISEADFTILGDSPEVSLSVLGGAVDDDCTFRVTFDGTVTDDCSVDVDDLEILAADIAGNSELGSPMLEAHQTDATTIEIEGSFEVSALEGPAKILVQVTAVDGCGFEGSAQEEVEVVDTTPPTIDVDLSPEVLWPPNHTLREILATVEVNDNCPLATFVLSSVTSDEPDDARGGGDGHTVGDIQGADTGTDDLIMLLRAERLGRSDGRTYTAVYTAMDGSGNEAAGAAEVTVPKSRRP